MVKKKNLGKKLVKKKTKVVRTGLEAKLTTNHHTLTAEIAFLIITLLIGGYFLIFHGGITGALVGNPEVVVDLEVWQDLVEDDEAAVIVILHENLPLSENQDLKEWQEFVANKQESVLNNLQLVAEQGWFGTVDQEFALNHRYSTINALAGSITSEGLKKLQQDYRVAKIKADKDIALLLDSSATVVKANYVNSLIWNGTMFNGAGQTVCIVDTGVDYTNPALGNCTAEQVANGQCRVIGYNVAENNTDPLDLNGHGTHVAGIVASNDTLYRGLAPGVRIAALKVFPGSSGVTNESNVIAGIDWCIAQANHWSISAISLSLGDGSTNSAYCDSSSLALAVNRAVEAGLVVSVASGNSGYPNSLSSPACASKVVSVGSTTKEDVIASYSNSASILDVLAPGSGIKSTALSRTIATRSGTSMSAPHVAGATVLIKQYFKQVYNLTLTPAELESRLKTGIYLLDTRNGLTFPRIDIYTAVKPEINFISPANNFSNFSIYENYLLVKGQTKLAISRATLELDGINQTMNLRNSTAFSLNLTNLSLGGHSYLIYVSDAVGLTTASEIRQFTLPSSVPEVVFNFADSFVNSGKFLINVTVTTPTSSIITVLNISFNVSNEQQSQSFVLAGVNLTSNQWITILNSSEINEGRWKIVAKASDRSGNSNSTEFRMLIVDRTPPVITNLTINSSLLTNGSLTVNSTIEFIAQVNDTNLAAVFLQSSHSGQLINYTMLQDKNYTAYFYKVNTTLVPGNYLYQLWAKDLATNLVNSSINKMIVVNRAPTDVVITTPANRSLFNNGTAIIFSGTAVDLDGQPLTYNWDFADGTTVSGQSVTHSYSSSANYTVKLTVSDSLVPTAVLVTIAITTPISNSSNNTTNSSNTNPSNNSPSNNSSNSTEGSSSGSTTSSSGGSGGGSGETSSRSDSSVSEADDSPPLEIDEIDSEVSELEQIEEISNVPETSESNSAESSPDSGFSLSLVGAAVGDFITNKNVIKIGSAVGIGLIIVIVTGYLILKRKHQAEIYGVERTGKNDK